MLFKDESNILRQTYYKQQITNNRPFLLEILVDYKGKMKSLEWAHLGKSLSPFFEITESAAAKYTEKNFHEQIRHQSLQNKNVLILFFILSLSFVCRKYMDYCF